MLLLFMVVIVSGLSAGTVIHVIESYEFDVLGKSQDFMLRRFIVPPEGDPEFHTLEEMIAALDEKQQILFNKRVFEKVSYAYDVIRKSENTLYYRVTFYVDDAFTLLPIPYPKYDSNYGFMFGLKVYDKNLFGVFGDFYSTVKATQIGSSWEDWDFFSEFSLSKLPIGTSILDLDGDFNGTFQNGAFDPESYTIGMDWEKIKLGSSTLFMNGEIGAVFSETEPDLYSANGEYEWKNIDIFGTSLNLSGWFEGEQEHEGEIQNLDYLFTGSWILGDPTRSAATVNASYQADNTFTTSLRFKEIALNDANVIFEPILVQYIDDLKWDLTDVQLRMIYSPFTINGEKYEVEFLNSLPIGEPVIETSSTLRLLEETFFSFPFDFYLHYEGSIDLIEWHIYENFYKAGISSKLTLPWNTIYAYDYSGEIFGQSADSLNSVPVFRTSQSLSFGEVNWVNNFRLGAEGSLNFTGAYANIEGLADPFDAYTFTTYGSLETFLPLGKRVEVSSRFTGMYAHLPQWAVDDMEAEDRHYPEYLPSKSTYIPDQIRGILNTEIESLIGDGDYRKLGAVANLDLTVMFIKFDGFAEGFLSAFMDVGVFTPSSTEVVGNTFDPENLILLKTVGVEGYGILDKFRSYPVRASLGVNLDDLIEHANGVRDFSDIGYELSLGMGLHY